MRLRRALPFALALVVAGCGGERAFHAGSGDGNASAAGMVQPIDRAAAQSRIVAAGSAKRLCSSVLVSGRSQQHVAAEELADAVAQGVTFSFQNGPRAVVAIANGVSATAVYRPHLGCTLLKDLTAAELAAQFDATAYPSIAARDPDALWPEGARVERVPMIPGIDLSAVQAAIDRAFEEPDPAQPIRTRAVVVVRDGRIVAERYAPPFHAQTPQLGWSMTKTVVNVLTGMLVRDGLLDVNGPPPVAAWNGGDPRGAITLRHLLQMSSGLAFAEVYRADAHSDVVNMLYGDGAHAMGEFAAAMPLFHAPGVHWSYASGTTNLIALIQRQAFPSQAAYFAYPRERLFNKLQMSSAVLEPDESGVFVGSSYMYATPRDWARLGLLLLQDGVWTGERLLPEGWVQRSLTPAPGAGQGQYGEQIWLNRGAPHDPADRPHPDLPPDMFYLSGFEGQNVIVVPSQRLIVVRMGLTTSGDRPIWNLVRELLAALAPEP